MLFEHVPRIEVISVSEEMMIERQSKKSGQHDTAQNKNKRKIVTKNTVKFIVPMPGSASWLLKSNDIDMENIDDHEFNSGFGSENCADHSHLIMNRKYYID